LSKEIIALMVQQEINTQARAPIFDLPAARRFSASAIKAI